METDLNPKPRPQPHPKQKPQSGSTLLLNDEHLRVDARLELARTRRTHSVPAPSARTPSATSLARAVRRDSYAGLPFVGVFGMQHVAKPQPEEGKQEEFRDLVGPEVPASKDQLTSTLLISALVSMVGEFLNGYNTGVMNSVEGVVFPGHTTLQWSMAVSAFAIGGPAGAVLGGTLANRYGRRFALLANACIFVVGGLIMTTAVSIYWLIFARFIVGFSCAFADVVVPIYIGELAPPSLRGTLGTLSQFAVVTGILFSNILAFPFATESSWRILFAVTPVLAAVQLLCSRFLHRSPKWLLSGDKSSVEARVTLKRLRSDEVPIEDEVDHILHAVEVQKLEEQSGVWELFTTKRIRVLVVSAIALQMAQQLCGINAVFYYSTSFFTGIITNPLLGSTLVAFVNVLATYLALRLMDATGRRQLLLYSATGMFVSTVIIIVSLLGYLPSIVSLLAVMTFVSFFAIGLGPIPKLIVAESFLPKYVCTAMSVACQVNWACNFAVGFSFPFMTAYLSAWSFGPFGVVLILTIAFVWGILPETRGRTVDEVQLIAAHMLELPVQSPLHALL